MRIVHRRFLALSFALLILIVTQTAGRVSAQVTTITLAVSAYQKDQFTERLIADFEAENPGIEVAILTIDPQLWVSSPSYLNEDQMQTEFYEKIEQFASAGDVIQLEYWGRLPPESTVAGYFLNLKPLADADSSLNSDDFYKGVWEFYQWDGGLWALPYQVNSHIVTYDAAAFDAVGLAYPDSTWTLIDFANAARALAVKDADGKVTTRGIDVGYNDEWYLLRSLLGEQGLADTTVIPNQAYLSGNPALPPLLVEWMALKAEGVVGPVYPDGGGIIEFQAPLAINSDWQITNTFGDARKMTGAALLPNDRAGLEVNGFAVSAGTLYPEAAYALAKFLTTRAEVFANYAYTAPARRSLADASPNTLLSSSNSLAPEMRTVLEAALENGFSVDDIRYFDYLSYGIGQQFPNNPETSAPDEAPTEESIADVLQAVDERANTILAGLVDNKANLQITVATPVPVAELAPGEVAIKFGLLSNPMMPKKPEWEAFMKGFADEDAQVGRVDLDITYGGQTPITDAYDCFYVMGDLLTGFDRSLLLPIDPYLNADSSIDQDDFIGGSLSSFQVDNMTYGLPMMIEPELLRLDIEQFEKAGVPLPNGKWTLNEFLDALETLRIAMDDPEKPMFSKSGSDTNGGYLMSLIAAAGALPIDQRDGTLKFDFTDPATVDAIRQILDLAKAKQLNYEALVRFSGGNVPSDVPIYTERFSALEQNYRMISMDEANYLTVTYPSGEFVPLLYNVTGVFISAQAQNPESCYRLMSKLSQTPSLFSAMPARRSVLESPDFVASVGEAQAEAYNALSEQLSDPQAVRIPSNMTGGYIRAEGYYIERWLFRAFDHYVLEDADLELELTQAQQLSQDFMACTEALPVMDVTDPGPYYEGMQKCLEKVDPSMVQN